MTVGDVLPESQSVEHSGLCGKKRNISKILGLNSEVCVHHPSVGGFGVVAFGVAPALSPAALLFLLDFFSLVLGVVGLFSLPFVAFLAGAGKSSVLSCGLGTALFAGVGTPAGWLEGFEASWAWLEGLDVVIDVANEVLCDFDNLKAPGSPTIGFSSMYSFS